MPAQPNRIGRYELVELLGAGGMGEVYAARDQGDGRLVALKRLRHVSGSTLYRFKREFRALADMNHPNLVALYELGTEDGDWYFTMELVAGVDFHAFVRHSHARRRAITPAPKKKGGATADAEGPLDSPEQLERLRLATRQLARGLSALHDSGIVHRDVKPKNILVTAEQRVVLLDFGLIADTSDQDISLNPSVVGTIHYMAPEQASSETATPAADWYSVGVLLFEALTGQRPFSGAPLEVLSNKVTGEPPRAHDIVPSIPEDLDEICTRLMRREPNQRLTGKELLRRLGDEADDASLDSASAPAAPVFVGRARELGKLRSAVDDAAKGEAVVVFVSGESGVGKTSMAMELIQDLAAASPDAVICSGRCYERESVPYKGVDGVIDALSRHLKALDFEVCSALLPPDAVLLARLFPVLGRVPAIARLRMLRLEPGSRHHLRMRAFAALRGLLARLAKRSTLVVFVDDFQWTDADSVALLSEVLQAPEAPNLMFMATVRTSADSPPSPHVAALREVAARVETIELGALTQDEAVALARELLHRDGASRSSDPETVASEAAGHPLFISEIAQHLASAPEVGIGAERLEDALWARVSRLERDARRLLEVLAIAGFPLSREIAADAAGVSLADCGRWATTLQFLRLVRASGERSVGSIEPYHDRVAKAVASRLEEETRRIYHLNLADALQAAGAADAQPEILVHHLEAGGLRAQAAGLASTAARRAADALAFERAATLYESALRLGDPAAEERDRLRLDLAAALSNAGRGREAAELYQQASEAADPATRLDCLRRAAEQFLLTGHIERGLAALDLVLADAGMRMPASPRSALAALLWRRTRLRIRGLRWKQSSEGDIAQRNLNRIDVLTSVSLSLSVVDNIRGAHFQSRALLMALRAGEPRRVVRCIGLESMMLASRGKPRPRARATRIADEITRLEEEMKDPLVTAWALGTKAMNLHFAGHFPRAAEALQRAIEQFRDRTSGTRFELNSLLMFRLLGLRFMGRFRELRTGFDEQVRDARRRGDRYTEATLRRSFSQIWLVSGEVARARRDLEGLEWSAPGKSYHLQHWYELRSHAEVDLYVDSATDTRERAASGLRSLEDSFLLRVQSVRFDYYWLLARLLLYEIDAGAAPTPRLRLAASCARKLDREAVGHARAAGRMVAAAVAHQKGERDRALRLLDEAVSVAATEELGMFAAAARHRSGTLQEGERGATVIRDSEEWMRAQSIRDPEAMVRLYAPGFSNKSS